MKLLLDSCSFIWLATEPSRLTKPARAALTDPDNQTFLSAASTWEVSIKYSIGKLDLPDRPDTWIPRVREASCVNSFPIDEESTLLAGRLARFHADPFDRILIAQAIVHGMTIVTPDRAIEQYAVRVLW